MRISESEIVARKNKIESLREEAKRELDSKYSTIDKADLSKKVEDWIRGWESFDSLSESEKSEALKLIYTDSLKASEAERLKVIIKFFKGTSDPKFVELAKKMEQLKPNVYSSSDVAIARTVMKDLPLKTTQKEIKEIQKRSKKSKKSHLKLMKKHKNIAKLLSYHHVGEVYDAIEKFFKEHGKDVSKEYWIEDLVREYQTEALIMLRNLGCLAFVSSSKIGKVR